MTHSPHVVSIRLNLTIYAVLLALMGLTIAVAYVDLGSRWGLAVALSIATVKAVLILLYFMHVRWGGKLIWVFSSAAFFWLLILLALSFNDFFTRGWVEILGK